MTAPQQHAITGVDHCIILVNDLDAAEAQMRKLGFAPAPRGVHSDHMGTHNHCVMLERGYFEVMGIRFPTDHNARWRNSLANREGLAAIAHETGDARAAVTYFNTAGVAASEVVDFSRPVDLGDHAEDASFSTLTLPSDVMPVPGFLCQHHTRHLVWRPEYLTHANTARSLDRVVLVADDPAASAAMMAPAYGAERVTRIDDGMRIDMGASGIDVIDRNALAARYANVPLDETASTPYVAALSFSVGDLAATRRCLEDEQIPVFESAAGHLCVAPANACGALLEFS